MTPTAWLMLASAPLSAIYDHHKGLPNYAGDYRLVAHAVERVWRAHTDRPLRVVMIGTDDLC